MECKTSPFENGGVCTGIIKAVLGSNQAVFRFFQLYKQPIKVLPNPENQIFLMLNAIFLMLSVEC